MTQRFCVPIAVAPAWASFALADDAKHPLPPDAAQQQALALYGYECGSNIAAEDMQVWMEPDYE